MELFEFFECFRKILDLCLLLVVPLLPLKVIDFQTLTESSEFRDSFKRLALSPNYIC